MPPSDGNDRRKAERDGTWALPKKNFRIHRPIMMEVLLLRLTRDGVFYTFV